MISGSNSDAITPLRRGVRIGQRQQLSPLDVAGIVEYYECGKQRGKCIDCTFVVTLKLC